MMELIVAAGLMTLVSAGVATGIYRVMTSQNELNKKFDGSEFVASLGRSMTDRATCRSFLSGQILPTTTEFRPLTMAGYKGFGDSAQPLASGYIIAGTATSPQVVVTDLSWRLKEIVPASSYFRMTHNGVTAEYLKAPMQLRVNLSVYQNGIATALPSRYLDYSVVALTGTRAVTDCDGAPSVADTCAMLGSTLNPDGTCQINVEGCVIRGSYVNSRCSPTGYTCRATTSSPSRPHPETGTFSCPAGSQAFTSFNYTWVSEERTGKKSDINVTNTIQAYMCMSCR
ncbi:hypothetical protein AZI86_04710 [Bdellovibrio bacteriovorus]|uniref:Uncharacterized protein n=1 Tax=Bdellovibrio bacteriovorus TaxID=959 RepID=A0A150WPK7_BDEBC|nr:hypothetical protein [Bdellovibrio bacteriovorus]KYG66360.1 hypothetical protein AZI86_04710 [Bdellovibrio bacteriovorus]